MTHHRGPLRNAAARMQSCVCTMSEKSKRGALVAASAHTTTQWASHTLKWAISPSTGRRSLLASPSQPNTVNTRRAPTSFTMSCLHTAASRHCSWHSHQAVRVAIMSATQLRESKRGLDTLGEDRGQGRGGLGSRSSGRTSPYTGTPPEPLRPCRRRMTISRFAVQAFCHEGPLHQQAGEGLCGGR